MPHLTIEYTANLDEQVDIDQLVGHVHEAAIGTGVCEIGGIRTRAVRREHFRIADGHPENTFVHVVARMRHGRDLEVRRDFGKRLFDVICEVLADVYERIPIGISFEVQEIHPELNFKKNNLHAHALRRSERP